jgi:hypothetical protein
MGHGAVVATTDDAISLRFTVVDTSSADDVQCRPRCRDSARRDRDHPEDDRSPASALLGYVLTSDALHAVNWGGTISTDTVAGIGNGAAQAITVYGQVAAGQYVAPGAS